MRKHRPCAPLALFALLAALLAACGGGDGTGIFNVFDDIQERNRTVDFIAIDTNKNSPADNGYFYTVRTKKVAEGTHCRIYLESGRSVAQATIDALRADFDNVIYPRVTAAFGTEPNPGVDGDPKIHIVLLDIRDAFDPPYNLTYVGGYFFPANEYGQADIDAYNRQHPNARLQTNAKEILFVDVYPSDPASPAMLRTIAHEFQHMVHFEQQETNKGAVDDTWLNEAMSEVAPAYCGYGPDFARVATFEGNPSDSLTVWGDSVDDYGVVNMWATYFRDRFDGAGDNTVFWKMLHNAEVGTASVDAVLSGAGETFAGTFRDWAIANYSGNALRWPGHPEWSYASIDTWPGMHGGEDLAGLFSGTANRNATAIPPLGPWAAAYFHYSGGNRVTWPGAPGYAASFADNATIASDMTPGAPYPYANVGYLIVTSGPLGGNGGTVFPSRPAAPRKTLPEYLREAGRHPAARAALRPGGAPLVLCVNPFLDGPARELISLGVKPSRAARR